MRKFITRRALFVMILSSLVFIGTVAKADGLFEEATKIVFTKTLSKVIYRATDSHLITALIMEIDEQDINNVVKLSQGKTIKRDLGLVTIDKVQSVLIEQELQKLRDY